jgi:hypothetical protein
MVGTLMNKQEINRLPGKLAQFLIAVNTCTNWLLLVGIGKEAQGHKE